MSIKVLQELIDKQDNFEIVRNQIAQILADETANQIALAVAAGKEPLLWTLDVFMERSNPWEKYLNQTTDQVPIVNVWYDNSSFPKGRGGTTEQQQADGIFNIDMYGFGVSEETAGGHDPGDEKAAANVQRAIKLVRNILMADTNTYLQLRKTVGERWPQSIQSFQPEILDRSVQKIIGMRLSLAVRFFENAPQYVPNTLCIVAVDVLQDSDGKVLAQAQYGEDTATTRNFTTFKRTGSQYARTGATITLPGDFSFKCDFTKGTNTNVSLTGNAGSSTSYIHWTSATNIQNKIDSFIETFPTVDLLDGKLHGIELTRTSGVVELFIDGASFGIGALSSTDDFVIDFISGNNTPSFFWEGILANVEIRDAGALIHSWPMDEADPSAMTDREGSNDLTGTNLSTIDSEPFTFDGSVSPNTWTNVGATRIIEVAGT